MIQASGLTTSKYGITAAHKVHVLGIENAMYFKTPPRNMRLLANIWQIWWVGIYYISFISLMEARDVKGFLVLEGNEHIFQLLDSQIKY